MLGRVTQTLSNLDGTYQFSYYYRVVSVSPGADYVCNMQLNVGEISVQGAIEDSPGGWKSWSVTFPDVNAAEADVQLVTACQGEFVQIQVNVDTLAFTRVCSV